MQDLEGEQGSVQITEVGLDCFNVFKEILDTSNSQLVLSFSSNNAYFMASICVWLVTCMADDCNSKQRSCCTEDFSLAMRVDKGHMFHSPLSFSDGFKSKTSQGLVIPFESSVLPGQAAFLVQCLAG